jgi:hypothetical protein
MHPSGFDQLMDKTIASALVDLLMHHAHVIVTEGCRQTASPCAWPTPSRARGWCP